MMALFGLIFVLELGPIITFIRWRSQVARGERPDTRLAARFTRVSFLQAILVVTMVLAATAMARGYGVPGT